MRHILINGANGVGKSTLIRALLDAIDLPVEGVITRKEAPGENGLCPVYIHVYGEPQQFAVENCIGECSETGSVAHPEAFDRFCERMHFSGNGVVVFDELGFMESKATRFTDTVLQTLDRVPFCICAIRDRHTDFLNAVRSHPRAVVFSITKENRDALREQILSRLPELMSDQSSSL